MKKSVVAGLAGAVRVAPLTLSELKKQEKHGRRTDTTSQARRINDVAPVSTTGLDLIALYEAHVRDAFLPKAKTKALHVLVQFPRDLVDHEDAEALLYHARAFGKRIWGDNAIVADRYDRDEKSKAVVDLFVVPKYLKTTKRNPLGRLAVSMTKHNKLLAEKHGRVPTNVWDVGKSLQDELYHYLRDEMGLEGVERGSPKIYAGSDWKSAEQLRNEELEEERQRLQQKAVELEAREKRVNAIEASLQQERRGFDVEAEQAKLLMRATDDGEGLSLTVVETGKPEMNEAAMSGSERIAYHSTWSERMLDLAQMIAKALQGMREKVAAVRRKEKALQDQETQLVERETRARNRLDDVRAAEDAISQAKALANAFLAAWKHIPDAQRSPPIRDAASKAEVLVKPKGAQPANPDGSDEPTSRSDAIAALRKLTRGPYENDPQRQGGPLRPSGREGPSR